MSDLIQLVYVSRAKQRFTLNALTELLGKARNVNQNIAITGMLLYDGESFMQVLEGERQHVEELYARIQQDPRHDNIVHVYDRPIAERQFPGWSMGFQNVTDEMRQQIDGLNDFFTSKTCLADVDNNRAVRILNAFAKSA